MKRTSETARVLYGRRKKMQALIACIRDGKNLHVHGPEGAGKSALLDWTYSNCREMDRSLTTIYCRSSRSLRQILLCISVFLLGQFRTLESADKFKRVKEIRCASDIKSLSIRALRDLIFAYLPRRRFCVILDHLEYVTPKINGFLQALYEAVPVITASRQSWELNDCSFKGGAGCCLYLVPKLRIDNLMRKEALLLMKDLGENLDMELPAKRRLFDEVFRISRGNPGVIRRIFEKAQRPEYFKEGGLNLGLLMLDLKIEELAYQ